VAKFEAEIARATTDVAGEMAAGQAALTKAAAARGVQVIECHLR
jgi:hypothetical protein